MDDTPPIVIDNGSYSIKAGFAGEAHPRVSFHTIVGHEKHRRVGADCEAKLDEIAGTRAMRLYHARGDERLRFRWIHPVEKGIIEKFDDMALIWQTVFAELGVNPVKHQVLLTEPAFTTRESREGGARVMFRHFRVPALFYASQPSLIIQSCGCPIACVVDIGDTMTQVVPFYEKFPLHHASKLLSIGGRDITHFFKRLVFPKTIHGADYPDSWYTSLKEECCFVASRNGNYDAPPMNPSNPEMELGALVTSERSMAPECLFDPRLIGVDSPPLPVVIRNVIEACDTDIHDDLWQHVLLAGGTSMLPHLAERLERELQLLVPGRKNLRIQCAPDPPNGAWLGGSQMVQDRVFDRWVSENEYKEVGNQYQPPRGTF